MVATKTPPTPHPHRPAAPAASAALARLELVLLPLEVRKAVTRYKVASARTAELSHLMDSRNLSGAEFNALFDAQTAMAGARAELKDAGRLDLIEVA
jgi:hypothetical protein